MNTALISTRTPVFPCVLRFTNLRLYAFVTLFVALDVVIPWFCHWIHPLAGPTFLPMFFFVLLAGLLFGWRAGLLVGALTPIISYGISGMPLLPFLPGIFAEAVFYGLAAGLLRERFKMNVFWSLVGAMIAGRFAAGLTVFIVYWSATNPFASIWEAAKLGWPGIVIQLTLLPLISAELERFFAKTGQTDAKS